MRKHDKDTILALIDNVLNFPIKIRNVFYHARLL